MNTLALAMIGDLNHGFDYEYNQKKLPTFTSVVYCNSLKYCLKVCPMQSQCTFLLTNEVNKKEKLRQFILQTLFT